MPHLHRHQQGSSIGHFSFLPMSTRWCFGTPRLTPMQTPLQYSRLPLQVEPSTTHTPPELILLAEHLDDSPVTASDICEWTKKAFLKYCISSIRGGQIIAMQTWSHFLRRERSCLCTMGAYFGVPECSFLRQGEILCFINYTRDTQGLRR